MLPPRDATKPVDVPPHQHSCVHPPDLLSSQDGDGQLTQAEFVPFIVKLVKHLELSERGIYRLFATADMNANGAIEYEEFIPVRLPDRFCETEL